MGYTETPVGKYQSTLRKIHEDLQSHLHRSISLNHKNVTCSLGDTDTPKHHCI